VIIFALAFTLWTVVSSPGMQKLGARIVAGYFSREWHTEVHIRDFRINIWDGLVIDDIILKDRKGEEIFSAHRFAVRPGSIRLSRHRISIAKVFIDHGVIQVITHKGDSALNFKFIIDYFASKDTAKTKDTSKGPVWKFSVSNIALLSTRFHIQDENKPAVPFGIDYANIDVRNIDLDLTDLRFDGDTIHANIHHLVAQERSGFNVRRLSGEFHVSPCFLKANNLKILTDHSDLSLNFAFLYHSWSAYNDFLKDITIQGNIAPSYLDLQDIGFFATDIRRMKDRFRFEGKVQGTVNNFRATDFRVSYGNCTYFWGNIRAFGLPDVEQTYVNLDVKHITTSKSDIESFLLPGLGDSIKLPGILANIGLLAFKGNFTGFYNDFVSNAVFTTNLGSVRTDLEIHRTRDEFKLNYDGQLDVLGFDIGRLTGDSAIIGVTSFRAGLKGKGLNFKDADLEMNVHVDSIRLLAYNYHKLDIHGLLEKKRFNGILDVNDTNLKMNFIGMMNFTDSIPDFDFRSSIHRVQLFNLKFLKRDSTLIVSTNIRAAFKGSGLDNLDGYINLENTAYKEGKKDIFMKNLRLSSDLDENRKKAYYLKSDFVDADFNGDFKFKKIIPSLYIFVKNYLASFTLRASAKLDSLGAGKEELKYRIRFKNTDQVTNVFVPFLKISENSVLTGSYNEQKGLLSLSGQAPYLDISGIYILNWTIDAETSRDELKVNSGSDAVYFKRASKGDSMEMKLDTFRLKSHIRHDSVLYSLKWSDAGRSSGFEGYASFINSPKIDLKITDLGILINGKRWTANKENLIIIDTNNIQVNTLSFNAENQLLQIDGTISARHGDTLTVNFNRINISELDRLLKSRGVDVEGILSGQVKLQNIYRNITVISDIRLDQFKFNKELLGDALLNIKYDNAHERFDVRSRIEYTGNVGKNIPFDLQGSYYTGRHPTLDFNLDLKNLNLRMLQPFVISFMGGLNGWVTGHAKIRGTPDKPVLLGELNLSRTEFKINYLNVMYSLADVVRIDSNAFVFNKIAIYDSLGNKGYVNGRISHNYFRDMKLDLNIEMKNFSAFNNTYLQNPVFYGKAKGTGNVHIYGPFNDIVIDAKAETGKNTNVVIPISLTQSVNQNDFIIFVNKTDTLNAKDKPKKDQTNLTLNLALRANPDAQVEVFFPDQLGSLKAQGNGNIVMGMTPTTSFNMTGTYSITKGSFVFQLKNLLRLPMSITEGSRITWSGDPADASLAVNAVYRTKTSLAGLSTDATEEQMRFPVEVIIHLGGKLQNPDVRFSMNLPNVEDEIKVIVYKSIDTTNVSEMNQQMIYLLVMNQFKPVVSSSGTGINVGSTSLTLVTNQINSWLSGIANNVNVGVNYRPATSIDGQSWDVSMSTQLLNDRLQIDGTFGMNTYKNTTAQQASTIVGDINIEYMLTRNKRWRIFAFNRTNNVNSILYNNSPYTQGVGLKYQRDFYSFGELFGGKKWVAKQARKNAEKSTTSKGGNKPVQPDSGSEKK
jgi:hypothetical protein